MRTSIPISEVEDKPSAEAAACDPYVQLEMSRWLPHHSNLRWRLGIVKDYECITFVPMRKFRHGNSFRTRVDRSNYLILFDFKIVVNLCRRRSSHSAYGCKGVGVVACARECGSTNQKTCRAGFFRARVDITYKLSLGSCYYNRCGVGVAYASGTKFGGC